MDISARYCLVSFPEFKLRSGFLKWSLKLKDLTTDMSSTKAVGLKVVFVFLSCRRFSHVTTCYPRAPSG